jgi:hypothetical protein
LQKHTEQNHTSYNALVVSVILLSVLLQNVIMLNVILSNVILTVPLNFSFNVTLPDVILLSVVAPASVTNKKGFDDIDT